MKETLIIECSNVCFQRSIEDLISYYHGDLHGYNNEQTITLIADFDAEKVVDFINHANLYYSTDVRISRTVNVDLDYSYN